VYYLKCVINLCENLYQTKEWNSYQHDMKNSEPFTFCYCNRFISKMFLLKSGCTLYSGVSYSLENMVFMSLCGWCGIFAFCHMIMYNEYKMGIFTCEWHMEDMCAHHLHKLLYENLSLGAIIPLFISTVCHLSVLISKIEI
jgi:hypothetical protein